MYKTKLLTGILLVLAILFAQVGTVFAAPAAQDTTTLTGTVTNIAIETDLEGVTTVLVSVNGGQPVRVSVDYAVTLGLVTKDPVTKVVTPVVLDPAPPLTVTIDPAQVLPAPTEPAAEDVHPIAAILATFFEMDAGEVNDMHEDGYGFGLIAQALWMAKNINQDAITAGMILDAKRDNNFSGFCLSYDNTTTVDPAACEHPSNWGQLRKALLDKKQNLGVVVSGHANNEETDVTTMPDKGKDKEKNQGKGKGHNKNP